MLKNTHLCVAVILSIAMLPVGALAASAAVRVSAIVEPHCVVADRAALPLTCNGAVEAPYQFEVRTNASGQVTFSIDS